MKTNLKTATLMEDNSFHIIPGWHVAISPDEVFIDKLGTIPRNVANLKLSPPHPTYLLSASLVQEEIEENVPVSTENDVIYQKDSTNIKKIPVVKVEPQADDNIFFVFYLPDDKEISFSPIFKVFKENLTEAYNSPRKYVKMVYASLPASYDKVPLVLDHLNTICISPF